MTTIPSQNRKDATQNLIDKFQFATASKRLQLCNYRLTNTDVTQLKAEFATLTAKINHLNLILTERSALKRCDSWGIDSVRKRIPPRRSQIEAEVEDLVIDTAVTIAEEDVQVLVSVMDLPKRASLRSYKSIRCWQWVGWRWFASLCGSVNTTQHLFMFTNKGVSFYRPVHGVPDFKNWKDTGEHFSQQLANWRQMNMWSKWSQLIIWHKGGAFTIVTNDGFIKQTTLADMVP